MVVVICPDLRDEVTSITFISASINMVYKSQTDIKQIVIKPLRAVDIDSFSLSSSEGKKRGSDGTYNMLTSGLKFLLTGLRLIYLDVDEDK